MYFIIIKTEVEVDNTIPKPAIAIVACNMDATVFPSAVIIDIFVPCLIPWASASSMLGPGIMEATKTVII